MKPWCNIFTQNQKKTICQKIDKQSLENQYGKMVLVHFPNFSQSNLSQRIAVGIKMQGDPHVPPLSLASGGYKSNEPINYV